MSAAPHARPDAAAGPLPGAVRGEWSRLHPLSPIVRTSQALVGLFLLIGLRQVGSDGNHVVNWAIDGAVLTLAIAGAVVSWAVTRWRVVGTELQINTGLFRRQSIRVPLTRVQSIDVVRPLLGRALGMSELRVEVAGHGSGRSKLAYLHDDEAIRVRARLLAVAHGLHEDTPEPAQRPLWQVSNQRLMTAILLGPALIGLIMLVVLVVLLLTAPPKASGGILGIFLPVLVIFGTSVKRQLNNEFSFFVAEAPDGLRLHSGLTQTRAETIPYGRVQAMRWVRPLLWRPFGWVRLEIDVARQRQRDRDERESDQLVRAVMPVGTRRGRADAAQPDLSGRRHRAAGRLGAAATPGPLAGAAVLLVVAGVERRRLPADPYRPDPAGNGHPARWRRCSRCATCRARTSGGCGWPRVYADTAGRHWKAERRLSRRRRGRPVARAPDRGLAGGAQGRPAALPDSTCARLAALDPAASDLAPVPGAARCWSDRLSAASLAVQPLSAGAVTSATPAAPEAVPVVLDGTQVVVRWRIPDPTVTRVVVRRSVGTVAPASTRSTAPPFSTGRRRPGFSWRPTRVADRRHLYLRLLVLRRVRRRLGRGHPQIKATAPAAAQGPGDRVGRRAPAPRFGLSWGNPANPVGTPYTVKYATSAGAPWVIWLLDTSDTQAVFGAGAARSCRGRGRPTGSRCCRRTRTATTPGTRWRTVVEPYDTRSATSAERLADAGRRAVGGVARWPSRRGPARR